MSEKIKSRPLKAHEKIRRGDFILGKNGLPEVCGDCFHGFKASSFAHKVYRPARQPKWESLSITPYRRKDRQIKINHIFVKKRKPHNAI